MTTSGLGGQTAMTVIVSVTQHTQRIDSWTYRGTFAAAKLATWSIPKPEALSPATKFTSGSAVGATSSFTLCTDSGEEQDDKGHKD